MAKRLDVFKMLLGKEVGLGPGHIVLNGRKTIVVVVVNQGRLCSK